MSTIKDGGPVFPSLYSSQDYSTGFTRGYQSEPGMTLRDYFAAHAPSDPQPWFTPKMPPRPESRYVGEDGTVYASWREAEQECGDTYINSAATAQDDWHVELQKQRFIQWPYAWADEQLKQREAK